MSLLHNTLDAQKKYVIKHLFAVFSSKSSIKENNIITQNNLLTLTSKNILLYIICIRKVVTLGKY